VEQRVLDRFWLKVDRSGECWLWTGARYPSGYGVLTVGGRRNQYAHRLAWEIEHGGPIPEGVQVQHTCDAKACVNPAHLKLGTPKENSEDAVRRGRIAKYGDGMERRPRYQLRPGPTDWGRQRVAVNLSLRDMERLTGINRGYLSMLERGRYLPSPDEMRRIIAALEQARPVE
jgi:hypothetical protein